jgi:hypothetical protein
MWNVHHVVQDSLLTKKGLQVVKHVQRATCARQLAVVCKHLAEMGSLAKKGLLLVMYVNLVNTRYMTAARHHEPRQLV